MKLFGWPLAALALAPALFACNTALTPPATLTFSRPQRVAFACFDVDPLAKQLVLPLSSCKPLPTSSTTTTPVIYPPTEDTGVIPLLPTLHALVTQSDRGEVAAVDLVARVVIDSRPDIPGYTFLPVGELPGPIVIPAKHPALTYVANNGSHDISVLQTSAFRAIAVGQSATVQRLRLQFGDADKSVAPVDMVLSPDEDALFVTAPDAGMLMRLPLQRCDTVAAEDKASCHEGEIDAQHVTTVPLTASLSKAQVVAPPPGDEAEPYNWICKSGVVLPVSMAGTNPVPMPPDDAKPQPGGLAVDAFCRADGSECKRRILVADQRLPLIHVVDVDRMAAGDTDAAVLQPILTGVPTQRVAITPRVPVAIDSDEETQYVYAIDATDGSVLVVRDGRVINVSANPALRHDRIDLGNLTNTGTLVAVSLGVLTPRFDVNGPAAQWTSEGMSTETSDPTMCTDVTFQKRRADRLRGVFLAVGLTDGTLRVVDVHDMELAHCRRCDGQDPSMLPADADKDPMSKSTPADLLDPYPLLRNHTRIGLTYAPAVGDVAPPSSPLITPHFEIDSSVIGVNDDGTTVDSRVAGFDCLSCPDGQAVSFPDALTAVVDASVIDDLNPGAAGSDGEPIGPTHAGSGGTGKAGAGGGGGAGGVSAGDAGVNETADAAVSGSDTAGRVCAANQGRVCSLQDPWVAPGTWAAYYEGVVPGTRGGRGRFIEASSDDNRTGNLEFSGEVRFCSFGVLGTDDIGDDHTGDQVQITSVLPVDQEFFARAGKDADATLLHDDCLALVKARDEEKTPIAFRIKQAYADRLVVDGNLINRPAGIKGHPADFTFVRSCFLNMLMTYEVHVRDGYTVQDANATFPHRVVTDATTQRCTVDTKQSPKRNSRAYEGIVFDNGFVSFKLSQGKTAPRFGTRAVLVSDSRLAKIQFDATLGVAAINGVTPTDLQFSPTDQTLYVVDVAARGLIPVPVAPFPTSSAFSYQ